MPIKIHPHALERMRESGATEDEVRLTVEGGEEFPAKFDRTGFRRNFAFNLTSGFSDFNRPPINQNKDIDIDIITKIVKSIAIPWYIESMGGVFNVPTTIGFVMI